MRAAIARQLRRVADGVLDLWRIDDVQRPAQYDIAVLGFAGGLYNLADRMDP